MRSHRFLAMLAVGALTVGVLSECERGPMQKAGEKVDNVRERTGRKGGGTSRQGG